MVARSWGWGRRNLKRGRKRNNVKKGVGRYFGTDILEDEDGFDDGNGVERFGP